MNQVIGQALSLLPGSAIDLGLRTLRKFRFHKGRHIYDHDWDVLVILDACRYDMYREVVSEAESVLSVASTSTEWMDVTFDERYESAIEQTAYVSANPFSRQLDGSRFGAIDHVWEDHWDEQRGAIPAAPVTDHGIAAARSQEYNRVILHYMQPHFPFIGSEQFGRLGRDAFGLDGKETQNVWDIVEAGKIDADRVIEAYYENLRYVFDSVETVLENVDGKVVITADHANALGEWNLWGHRAYVPFKAVREVPWDVRDCVDKATYEPDASMDIFESDTVERDVEEQLKSLGYVDI